MCYRYTLQKVESLSAYDKSPTVAIADWQPRYNVALTTLMPVLVSEAKPTVRDLAFGFTLPARTAGVRPLLVANSRAETLLAKPSFRDAAQHRRYLVPADGFFEWEKQGTARLPHYFYLLDHRPFFFAGIWQPATESSPAGFSIITTKPNSLLQSIHDRMPVILGPNSGPAWLGDHPLDPILLERLCRPLSAEMMSSHRVAPRINNARYQAPDSVDPVPSLSQGI